LRAVKIINKKLLEEEEKAKLLKEIEILKQMVTSSDNLAGSSKHFKAL